MIFIAYILIFGILLSMYAIAPLFLDNGFIAQVLILDFIVLAIFVTYYYNLFRKNIFRHSIFFLFGFIVVHFQYLLVFCIYGQVDANTDIWVDKAIVCKSLVISSIGMLMFIMGYSYYMLNAGKRFISSNIANISKKIENRSSLQRRPIILIIVAYIAFAGFIYTADPRYLAGFYGSVDPGPAANRFQLILDTAIGAIMVINTRTLMAGPITSKDFYEHVKRMGVFFNILIAMYVGLVLFIGDRGPAITVMIFYLASYAFRVKDRPRPVVIITGLVLGVILMAFVGIYRSVDSNLSFTDKLSAAFSDKNSTVQTNELAGSIRSLHYAVASVPDKVNYKYGWFQLQQIIVAIPGSPFFLDQFDSNFQDRGSPALITYLDQGRFYSYGLGSTIIADFYIDLGVLGVIIGMFFFGYFMAKFEYVAYSNKSIGYLLFIFIMVFMSKSIYISRSTALSAFQASIWIYIVVIINQLFFKNIGIKFKVA